MRNDVLYEMTDGIIRSRVDTQHTWLNQYRVDSIKVGHLCEQYPALQIAWDQFKTTYEMCKAQDESNRQVS